MQKRDLIEKIEKIRENKKDIACGKTNSFLMLVPGSLIEL
jgi:hypothetical protein